MSYCVPIKDLKDTSAFAKMVKETDHPIFVTKNGREEFVVMSTTIYYENYNNLETVRRKFYEMIERGEQESREGKCKDAYEFLEELEVE